MKKTCFLTGFMGSGKTYWGTRLAEHLSMPFVDLDARIEATEQRSIDRIFNEEGEAVFRQLERNALHQLGHEQPCIVATGGGTPCFFDNMAWMNAHGVTIFLDVPVPVLSARLQTDQTTRPLLSGIPVEQLEAHISHMIEQRRPYYEKANAVVTDTNLPELEKLLLLAAE